VKFSARGGRVLVELVDAGSEATIRISDEGEGIAPEFLPHLFEAFRQGDATTARKHGGLGLGLSIVKQLVELHGGQVRAASDGPGRGTVVTITLPLSRADGTAVAAPPLEREGPSLRLFGLKVLVLDDEQDALTVIRRLLEDNDTEVSTASTSDEALELLAHRRFDAIVSDIAMPGRDGYAFITEVRARGIATPAIALTAFARREDRAKAMSSGFQAHVTKPVDQSQLLATLADLARDPRLSVPRRVESSEPLRERRTRDQPL